MREEFAAALEPFTTAEALARLRAADVPCGPIMSTQDLANDELENGLIAMAPYEIPRLDNDPSFRENGVLRLTAVGGL